MLHVRNPWIVTYMNNYIFNDDNFQQNLFYNMGAKSFSEGKVVWSGCSTPQNEELWKMHVLVTETVYQRGLTDEKIQ